MINCQTFLHWLNEKNITFSAGVPDSLLKNICACITDQGGDIITANEGAAVALATGYHLATGKVPMVYMQNSGFGNTINPLTSLTDPEVYGIPMLLMVGWRGQPGIKDEPQHIKMGRVNEKLIQTLELPYVILSQDQTVAYRQLTNAVDTAVRDQTPYVLLVKENTFAPYRTIGTEDYESDFSLTREDAVKKILNLIEPDALLVSTTGKTSREVFESRANIQEGHHRDFLTVGCMGHASQIALGIALQKPQTVVYCLDGDGAVIMHMGSLAIIGDKGPANYRHIIINNGSHDSVGGQPTVAYQLDFEKIAIGCRYKSYFQANNAREIENNWQAFVNSEGPVMMEIKTRKGAREDLGRPTRKPIENKADLMEYMKLCK